MNPCQPVNREGLIYALLTLILPFILFGHSFAQESVKTKTVQAIKGVGYKFFIKDHRITLNAKEASLKMILKDIGQEMNVEMIVRLPEEDKVTLQFNDQTLEETLKLFRVNYAMVTDSKEKDGHIKRIVVVPERQKPNLAIKSSGESDQKNNSELSQERASSHQPFKFEFDPSQFLNSTK